VDFDGFWCNNPKALQFGLWKTIYWKFEYHGHSGIRAIPNVCFRFIFIYKKQKLGKLRIDIKANYNGVEYCFYNCQCPIVLFKFQQLYLFSILGFMRKSIYMFLGIVVAVF